MRGISVPTWTNKICIMLALAGLLVSAAAAQGPPPGQGNVVIAPGADLFKSPAALGSEYDIGNCMIPGEFFEVGEPELTGCEVPAVPSDPDDPSSPLSFVLGLEGVPLQTFQSFEVGTIDTVVQRLQALDFGVNPEMEVSASTPVEVVALRLISTEPIEIACDQGVTRWIAEVEVDEETGPSPGQMDVTLQPELNGGTASSVLDICPRVTFTRIDPGASGSFEVFPCDLLCGPQLEGETTWSLEPPDPDNALQIRGLTSDNFFFTELLTPAEAAAVAAATPPTKMDTCNPDCPCIFRYPHLSATHRHQACLPCPCDADMQDPEVTPPADLTVECTEPGGTSRFATCEDGTLCILNWLDSATCVDQPGADPSRISSCGAVGAPSFFPAGCAPGQETPVTFQAVDECCNDDTDSASVFVQDTTPPVVTPGDQDLACILPNNGDYHCFEMGQFTPTIEDVCFPGTIDWVFTGCASDQPDNAMGPDSGGDGNTINDCHVCQGAGDPVGTCSSFAAGDAFCVRAERLAPDPDGNNGRRYEVEVQPTDGCDNVGAVEVIGNIFVPFNAAVEPDCPPEPPVVDCSVRDIGGGVNGNFVLIDIAAILGLPAGSVNVTSIMQDEPVFGVGNDEGPDGVIFGDVACISADIVPMSDGRIYTIDFTMTDGSTPPCGGGQLSFCMAQGNNCVDSGTTIDSTTDTGGTVPATPADCDERDLTP